MTPETYMRRYHGTCDSDDAAALTAEEVFPSCPLSDACGSQSEGNEVPACCCKVSMVEALRLLCDPTLASLVDFDAFFFLTNTLAVGGTLTVPAAGPDNLGGLAASFRRFSPCNCDLIDVDGSAYFTTPGTTTIALESVDQLSLCSVKAVAFGLTELNCPTECDDTAYRRAVRNIRRAIRAEGGDTSVCATCGGSGNSTGNGYDCDTCCCDAGILTELATRNLSRLATLTVGPLVLQNVTVLGAVGSVLVLADEGQERIYFVCVSQVEALG